MSQTLDAARYRWLVIAVFVLSSSINYLDRALLATLAPFISEEFHLSNEDYGWIVAAFSITYAASAPFAGMLIDRIGLNRAISLAVGLWSCAGVATGFTRGMAGLLGCRAVLGVAEAGGVPSVGKAIHQYLPPAEHAIGQAVSQAGLSLGLILAPPLATWITLRANWRVTFVVTGLLGFLWIPLWNWMARRAPGKPAQPAPPGFDILRDHRLWTFAAANAVGMVGYSLWTNWINKYLVTVHHISPVQAGWIAWIPPLFGSLGGITGGWLSFRLMRRGVPAVRSRFRLCLMAGVLSLGTAALPFAPTPAWACAGISLSFAAVAAFSVNMYTLPLDTFQGSRAAFAISMLVSSYGVMQLISPAFGRIIDHHGYTPLTTLTAFTPLAACGILWVTRSVH